MKEWAMADPLDHVVLTNVSAPPRAGDPPMDPERVWYLLGLFLDACLPSVRAQGVPHTWLVWFDDRADPDLVAKLQGLAKQGFDERIYVRGDKQVDYGRVASVMSTITAAGFKRVALVTEPASR